MDEEREMNVLSDRWTSEPMEHGEYRWNRMRVAGKRLGASLYELAPGARTFPYHYEMGNEELLVVVAGQPTLREPNGERELQPGDCILFPQGPAGAHQVINRSTESARVLIVSNFALPRAAFQPDSGKVMIRWGPEQGDSLWFRREDASDYWEGE
jgi:uncharacterized cupin superfamily protein